MLSEFVLCFFFNSRALEGMATKENNHQGSDTIAPAVNGTLAQAAQGMVELTSLQKLIRHLGT